MLQMNVWDGLLLAAGAFIAVRALVRLMRGRRDALLAELTAQAKEEQQRKKLADMLEKKKKQPKAA